MAETPNTAAPAPTKAEAKAQKAKQKKVHSREDSKRIIHLLKAHRIFIVFVGSLLLIMLVLLRVNMLNSMPVDQSYVQNELSSLKKATFNEDVIKKMEALKDSGVTSPGSKENPNRTNPFGE